MAKHFNKLTPRDQEALVLLVEEAAETVMAVAKALRHGLNSMHPSIRPDNITEHHIPDNRYDIAREAGQFVGVLAHAINLGILDEKMVNEASEEKMRNSAPYLHHQGDPT